MRQIFLLTFISTSFLSNGQTRTITGKVISENFETLPEVRIQNRDTIRLGTTDKNGNFKIELPNGTDELLLSFIGMEWTLLKVPLNCDKIEVIMMFEGTYDFMSNRKVDRLRKKRFDELPKLHSSAVAKGIFYESPCFTREFEPYKARLDEISKDLKVQQAQIKELFKRLQIGDSVSIPFPTSYRDDGTDRTTLNYYSFVADKRHFDCVIKAIIVGKDKSKRGYNITCKVTSCDLCKYGQLVFQQKEMVIGRVFKYNMRYFKVLVK
jgi:hypothetical protein